MKANANLPEVTEQNIALIKEIEERLRRKRTVAERISEVVLGGVGSFYFMLIQVAFLATWLWIDKPPFPLLGITLSITFFFLSVLILVSQAKQTRQAESWAHLDLQLSMLMEQELTECMRMLVAVCERLNLDLNRRDTELADLIQPTSVTAVAGELDRVRDEKIDPPSENG